MTLRQSIKSTFKRRQSRQKRTTIVLIIMCVDWFKGQPIAAFYIRVFLDTKKKVVHLFICIYIEIFILITLILFLNSPVKNMSIFGRTVFISQINLLIFNYNLRIPTFLLLNNPHLCNTKIMIRCVCLLFKPLCES